MAGSLRNPRHRLYAGSLDFRKKIIFLKAYNIYEVIMDDFEFFMESQGEEKGEEFPNLPVELQGKDLNPDHMDRLKNDFPVIVDYIAISFRCDQTQEVADFLGIPLLDTKKKNTYKFDELKGNRKYGLL